MTKDLLHEINKLLAADGDYKSAGDAAGLGPVISEGPEVMTFEFLQLECLEKDLGRAMAIRNYWAWCVTGEEAC